MASPTRITERVKKAKKTASGQNRKREQARAQRILSEKKLEAALGEHIPLAPVR